MLVSYTYRSDDPAPSESNDGEGLSKVASKPPEIKTFAFYTVVDLGQIIPRDATKAGTELIPQT
jgi:dynactin-4